jgi:hypothetical protein
MSTTRSLQPQPVHSAFVLWLVAVAAGVFETVLAVADLVSDGAEPGAIIAGVTVRTAVFGTAIFLALRLRQGRNWARMGLAVLLGVLGSLSLLIDPIQWLIEGNSFSDAVAGADVTAVLFASSRVVHLAAVMGAMVLMFRPTANIYFRAAHS